MKHMLYKDRPSHLSQANRDPWCLLEDQCHSMHSRTTKIINAINCAKQARDNNHTFIMRPPS